jgi:hypothetical protein
MAEDIFEKLGPVLSTIGEQAAADLGGNPDGIYIYAEAAEGWYSSYVFRPEGDVLRFYSSSQELGHLIWDLWNMGEADRRWSVMEYEIRGDRFDVQFHYPEEIDVDDFDLDRRENILKKRFGDIPVIFPAWDPSRGMKL